MPGEIPLFGNFRPVLKEIEEGLNRLPHLQHIGDDGVDGVSAQFGHAAVRGLPHALNEGSPMRQAVFF